MADNALTEALSGFLLEYSEDDLYHLIDEKLKSGNHEIKFSLERFHLYDKSGNVKGVYDNEVFQYLSTAFDMFVLGAVPYIYDGGVYRADENGSRLKTMIRKLIFPQFIKSTTIKRIYDLFIGAAELQVTADDLNLYPAEWICFKNGFYDPVTRRLIPHDPKYRATVQIPYNYDPNTLTSGKEIEDWLRFAIPDGDDREMLLEYAGLCLTRDTRQQKFLILQGVGGSGKSTLIRLIETMIGSENIANISLSELTQRFAAYGLMGKLLNSCADLEVAALEDTSTLKKLLGEDSLRVEPKGKDAISIKSMARLIFSTNELPTVKSERSNGFYRRLQVLVMNRQPTTINAALFDELRGQINHFIRMCVEAVQRMYVRGTLLESDNSREAVKQMRTDSDTVEAWLSEMAVKLQGAREERGRLFRSYTSYCYQSDRQALGQTAFYKALRTKGFSELKTMGQRYFKGITLDKTALQSALTGQMIEVDVVSPFGDD